jgi:hypothetical protein
VENTYIGGTENGRTYILVKADWESKITADIVRGKGKQHEPACFFQLIGIGDPRFKRTKKNADHLLDSILPVSPTFPFSFWTESKCPFIYFSK